MDPELRLLEQLKGSGKPGLARALSLLEAEEPDGEALRLVECAHRRPRGRVIGITGAPGAGKSTLVGALIPRLRARGLTVAVLAVDPSSHRSGGALLGDRIRLALDPEDEGLFVRSLAARDRLGGLAEAAAGGVALLRALFDRVLVETVGIGQSEREVEEVSDLVVLAVPPEAGDLLQFIKAGVLEIPDLIAVTKTDLGERAAQAARALEAALAARPDGRRIPVHRIAAPRGDGVDQLVEALERSGADLERSGAIEARRRMRAEAQFLRMVREAFGRLGVELVQSGSIDDDRNRSPSGRFHHVSARLRARLLGEEKTPPPAQDGRRQAGRGEGGR